MKIIHCADLHLGSRLSSIKNEDKRNKRKRELLGTYDKLIQYAKDNDIKTIILSGDVFDSDSPSKKDKKYFYDSIKNNSDITFLYLKGNHDVKESFTETYDNLLLFSDDKWNKYAIDDVVISGIELSNNNSATIYSSLNLDKNDLNIVMMHGDINTKSDDYIDIKKLANKNIDYLALGHIHSYSETKIDDRGIAVYPGCLDGRGFDELGEKGFVEITIEDKKISYKFVKLSSRMIVEVPVDITGAANLYEAKTQVEKALSCIDKESIVKISLNGKVSFDYEDIDSSMEEFFKDKFFYIRVECNLSMLINVNDYSNDLSLRGEFVRQIAKSAYTDEEKEELLSLGIKLLNGEAIE